MGNEIVNLVRMDIQLAVWRHRQQFQKAQPVGGDLDEQLTRALSAAPAPPPSLMAYPLPGGRFDLQPGNLMANGHIKPLSNHKQFAGNTQQGLASKALAGTMREIAPSLGRPRTRLVTCKDSRIGKQTFERGSDLLIDGEVRSVVRHFVMWRWKTAQPLQAPISGVSAT
jgi:hypothetical protein